jgi:DNA-binding NtrC family response regulator
MTKGPARIVFLDDNADLRQLMAVLLTTRLGEECGCFASLMELENHAEEVLRARVAILDINLGPNVPDGVAAFHWLIEHGFGGKVIFFTGHARTNPQVALAERSGVAVLEKPLHPDKLVSFVKQALREVNGTHDLQ